MSLAPETHHAGINARVSPGVAQGPRVVELRAWREAHEPSRITRSNVRPGRAAGGPSTKPDRLAHALAWCRAYTATGRNPFSVSNLRAMQREGLDF